MDLHCTKGKKIFVIRNGVYFVKDVKKHWKRVFLRITFRQYKLRIRAPYSIVFQYQQICRVVTIFIFQ